MQWEGNVITGSELQWTFRSRAPFCTTGTFVEFGGPGGTTWRFTCDDGTGSLTVSIARAWDHNPQAQVWTPLGAFLTEAAATQPQRRGIDADRGPQQ
jgi:hypothetical protein